ncbi:MAG: hypothetical protein EOP12_05565, partial [Pseudomonas sp.]
MHPKLQLRPLLIAASFALNFSAAANAFAQTGSIDDIMADLDRKAEARAAKRVKDAVAQTAQLVVQADTQVKLRSTCSKKNHLEPDMHFSSPISTPEGRPWPEGVAAFTQRGYSNVSALQVDLTSIARSREFPAPSHQILITAVIANDQGWKANEIMATMARTSGLLAKCGIQSKLNIVKANFPAVAIGNLTSVDEQRGRYLVAHTPLKTKPILYFLKDTPEEVRADGSGHAFALNTGVRNLTGSPKLPGHGAAFFGRDTAVQANGSKYDYQAVEDDTFVIPVIHELGHLLGDRDHTDAGDPPNILQGVTNRLSADITPEQCEAFR